MKIRKFIRLNFKENCFYIFDNKDKKYPFYFTKKLVNMDELNNSFGGFERKGAAFIYNRLLCSIDYAAIVLFHFYQCMDSSKILVEFPRSYILKLARQGGSLPHKPDDYKIFFVYSNSSPVFSVSAFIHANSITEAQEEFKKHIQGLKKLHPRKYKNLKCIFSVVHEI